MTHFGAPRKGDTMTTAHRLGTAKKSGAGIPRAVGVVLAASVIVVASLFSLGTTASAAVIAKVDLGTSANYSVLAGSTVTNTGPSVLNKSLGLWPGTSITGFPPGMLTLPATTDNSNAVAQQAQSDLTAAYNDAAGRPLDATTTADLGGLTLEGGAYAGPSKSAIGLTGTLTLDGKNDPNTVFVFQTDSMLTTSSDSTVSLINGAQECNVFWQVGSSATLGTNSTLVGNVLALTSITVNTGVTVHGRALARNGAVTLDNDTFTSPTCAQGPAETTTTASGGTTTTLAGGTTTTVLGGTTTTVSGGRTTTTVSGGTTTTAFGSPTTRTPGISGGVPSTTPGTPTGSPGLPVSGSQSGVLLRLALAAIAGGMVLLALTAVLRANKHSGFDATD